MEKQAILDFHHFNRLEGYRRSTFTVFDADLVAVSPSNTYRVLRDADVMDCFNGKKSNIGTGFSQPFKPHDCWTLDVSYLNIACTLYFMRGELDGGSRCSIHQEIREKLRRLISKSSLREQEKSTLMRSLVSSPIIVSSSHRVPSRYSFELQE